MKNVLLITIDALRPDHLGCYGYQRNTSPFMDKLAKEGIRFDNAFATGPFTPPSFVSILGGCYPLKYGKYLPLPKEVKLLSEFLQEHDYKTAAIHSNPYLSRYYDYDRGWDFFQDYLIKNRRLKTNRKPRNRILKIIEKNKLLKEAAYKLYPFIKSRKAISKIDCHESAETQTDDVIGWVKDRSNFFLWLHYMDTHDPYFPPDKYRKKFSKVSRREMCELDLKFHKASNENYQLSKEDLDKIKDLYDAEIKYVDDHIKRLITSLKKQNLYKDTLIIITSDHGEEFYEHGDVWHKSKLYDVNLKVPLIFLNSGKEIAKNSLVSLLDVPPTILDLLGIKKPKKWDGQSFFEKSRKRILFESYSCARRQPFNEYSNGKKIFSKGVRTKKWKYIIDDAEGEELYNLKNDPKEQKNLSNKKKYAKTKENMKKLIKKKLGLKNNLTISGKKEKRTEKEKEIIKERLKGLGYID